MRLKQYAERSEISGRRLIFVTINLSRLLCFWSGFFDTIIEFSCGYPMLRINFADILRATLPLRSGNEGWIGVSPTGDQYHIVVPVDRQIARGVMAGNLPEDGTPFGGYSGWLYFPCEPFEDENKTGAALEKLRVDQARASADSLVKWLAGYHIRVEITGNGAVSPESDGERAGISGTADGPARRLSGPAGAGDGREPLLCDKCGKSWDTVGEFLRDPGTKMDRYRACLEDFREGKYVFAHSCGGAVNVPVTRLARPLHRGRSLAGSHACPGLCRYEKIGRDCSAVCEGSVYLRIARKLKPD